MHQIRFLLGLPLDPAEGAGRGVGKGKGCVVAVGEWTPLDTFIYILALTPSGTLLTLFQPCDFVIRVVFAGRVRTER